MRAGDDLTCGTRLGGSSVGIKQPFVWAVIVLDSVVIVVQTKMAETKLMAEIRTRRWVQHTLSDAALV